MTRSAGVREYGEYYGYYKIWGVEAAKHGIVYAWAYIFNIDSKRQKND